MCWNAQVSFAFALAQYLCLGYIIYRNKYMDRYFALIQFAVATQEWMQYFLWEYGIDENTTSNSCSRSNKNFTWVILFTTLLIPPTTALLGYTHTLRMDKITKKLTGSKGYDSKWINIYYVNLIFSCIFYWFAIFVNIYYDIFTNNQFCTYVGPYNHQVWAFTAVETMSPYIKEFCRIGYLNIAPCFLFLLPRWLFVPVALEVFFSFVGMVVYSEVESGSLWCWFNSCLALYYVLYPLGVDFFLPYANGEYKNQNNWIKGTKEMVLSYQSRLKRD